MSNKQNKSARHWGRAWMIVTLAMLIALVLGGKSTNLAYAASNQVPFTGSVSGTVTFTSPTTAVLSGSGIALLLGPINYGGNVSAITPTATGMMDVLVETLTAANGDTLTLLCNQVAVQKSPGIFEASDQWTVAGGTGRFAGATGSGTGVTHIDLNKGTYSKQLTGTISAPSGY